MSEFSSGDVTLRDGSCKAVMLLMKRVEREHGRGDGSAQKKTWPLNSAPSLLFRTLGGAASSPSCRSLRPPPRKFLWSWCGFVR